MAVQLVTKINRYIGTAAEIAALTLTGIPVGSTFFEADTGILKTLSAAGTLVVAPSETVALAAGTALAGKFVPVDTDGDEKFTAGNPASVQLSGSNLKEATTVNVLVAGTRVQLPDLVCSQVMIIAKRGNTGYIYVGGDDVSATVYGADLGELDCVVLPVSNTNEIYIDASVGGEGISYVAI